MWSTLIVAAVSLSSALVARSQDQATERWCDEGQTGLCFQRYYEQNLEAGWGYIFPQASANGGGGVPDEFIGIFTAPASVGWMGNSLGGAMRSNPLVVGWINGHSAVASVRRVENYGPPPTLSGPKVTVLGGSGITSSRQQRIIYRCQNCTSWTGGSGGIKLGGVSTFGFATHGSIKPVDPENAGSSLYQHTLVGQHTIDVPSAKTARYWENLSALQNLPMLPPPGTPTATTVAPAPTGTLSCPGGPAPSYSMIVAKGWRPVPVLGRLTRPRSITIDTKGNLLVLEGGKGITSHTLNDNGCVTNSNVVVADTTLNHGLDLTPAGDKIIASSSDIAWSWNYDPASRNASNKKPLITEMYNIGHSTRTVLVSRKYPNYLLAHVGSDSNIDIPSFQEESGRAQVRVFDMRTLPPAGLPYTRGKVMGYGLRNDVGIAEDRNGTIFSIENSMDNAYRQIGGVRKDIHNDNPAEKLYLLGNPSKPKSLFGGYPYCYTVWEPENFEDKVMQVGHWFVQAPNATMNDEWCEKNSEKPIALLPPHTAPLDMKFGTKPKDTNLYVGLHGSWNRDPPQGYKVVVVPGNYSSTGVWSPRGNLSATKTSFTDLLSNLDETRCQAGCFRPVGLVFADGGDRLYVSSDASGEVFMLQRDAEPSPNRNTPSLTSALRSLPGTTSTTSTTRTISSTSTLETTTSATVLDRPLQTLLGQCGGNGWTGPTVCSEGTFCRAINQSVSQCAQRAENGAWKRTSSNFLVSLCYFCLVVFGLV